MTTFRRFVEAVIAAIDGLRPTIPLIVPLYCPRCNVTKTRINRADALLLQERLPAVHRCGTRYQWRYEQP